MEATTGQPMGLDDVCGCGDVLAGLVVALEPDAVPVQRVARLWEAFGRIGRLATAAQLLLARQVEESPEWERAGCRSPAEFLARRSGRSVRAERDAIKTSKWLVDRPAITVVLRAGELSEPRAALITDAATADPTREDELVGLAGRLSLAELAQECGRIKAAADSDPEGRWQRIRESRPLRQRTDSDGAWCLWGHSTPDDGALVNHALGPLIDEQYAKARAEGRREHRDTYAWDAFMQLIHHYLDTDTDHAGDDGRQATRVDVDGAEHVDTGPGADPDSGDERTAAGADTSVRRTMADGVGRGSDSGTGPVQEGEAAGPPNRRLRRQQARATTRPKRKRVKPRHLVLLRIDLEALVRGRVDGDEVCEIGGTPVPVSVARGLLGDAILKLVITKGVDVVSVTHLGRAPTAAQRVALLWQRPLCSNEACGHGWVENDHRDDWSLTHTTRLHALYPLCPHCHRLKTHDGWALVEGTGRRAFVSPDDPRHPHNPRNIKRRRHPRSRSRCWVA